MLGTRTDRLAAFAGVAAVLLTACGGGGVSSEEAREIIVAGLVDDAGLDSDVAECVADGALAEHDPDELVNERGTTTDEVNESVAAITADCIDEHTPTPPSTTAPATTLPATTVATTTPLDLTAYCDAAYDLVVIVRAADEHMDEPGPRALEEFFAEGLGRAELAVLAAPDNAHQEVPLEMVDRLEHFRDTLAEVGFDIEAEGGAAASQSAEEDAEALTQSADELHTLLVDDCGMGDGVGDDIDAEAAELGDALIALDAAVDTTVPSGSSTPDSTPDGEFTDVYHEASNIEVTVPAAWTAEEGGVDPNGRRFLVRAADLAAFNAPGVGGDGVRVVGADGTDYAALLAGNAPSQSCTLDGEDTYDDGVYVGTVQVYSACAGGSITAIVVAAADDESGVSALVEIHLTTPDDAAIDEILKTFYV